MLTRITIKNFKRFDEAVIELGNPVVFIGPNNSGKTTALQALALWDIGLKRWNEKREGKSAPKKRTGVAINRRDLISVPIPAANLLWRDLHVREAQSNANGKQMTRNIRVDIIVEGVTRGAGWACGLEFDYANEESFHCRPLRLSEKKNPERMPIPEQTKDINISFLPPMSGLTDREHVKLPGEINFLIGQGRTAEVVRNLCFQLLQRSNEDKDDWRNVVNSIHKLFGVQIDPPTFVTERSELVMTYHEASGIPLDISSAGRGLHQTLLLLTYLTLNPRSVLLLDEPDAHLEILRQQQIYQVLTDTAQRQGSQIVAASHSEVILEEAAGRDVVVAFVGKPHRIDDRGTQVKKALKNIGFDQYYKAEYARWVLYLEGSTDLAILRAFAHTLQHPAQSSLERPFTHYVANQPGKAREHFHGLCEAVPNLVGFALFDRLDLTLQDQPVLQQYMWKRREIENYLCTPDTLIAYAEACAMEAADEVSPGPLFQNHRKNEFRDTMDECIKDFAPPAALRGPNDPWWADVKASDDFLDRVFVAFFKKLDLPNLMSKSNYYVLAKYVPKEQIDPEIATALDAILNVANKANV